MNLAELEHDEGYRAFCQRTYFILKDDKTVVSCPDLLLWANWMEEHDKHIADDYIGCVRVSSVFLGMNVNFLHDYPPILFETMTAIVDPVSHEVVQCQDKDYFCFHRIIMRYSTYADAKAAHAIIVGKANELLPHVFEEPKAFLNLLVSEVSQSVDIF